MGRQHLDSFFTAYQRSENDAPGGTMIGTGRQRGKKSEIDTEAPADC